MANSKDTFTANTFTANTFTPLPSPLPQGARGLNGERSEQDVPTLPINMGFGVSFLGLLRRNSPRPLAGEGLVERGNVAQNDARFPRIEYGAGSNVEHGMTELEHGMTQEVVGWGFNPTLSTHAPTQYAIAANTTLTNGNFSGTPTPALPLTGGGSLSAWETTGMVITNNGAAVLSEVATTQTRLNQVFVVGADDRYLSFTLSNIGLEGTSAITPASSLSPTPLPRVGEGLPSDAFEVALLNANTGASLTAPIGLTRADALLNIQANGAELKATGVTSVINPDGSRTYVVDSM